MNTLEVHITKYISLKNNMNTEKIKYYKYNIVRLLKGIFNRGTIEFPP